MSQKLPVKLQKIPANENQTYSLGDYMTWDVQNIDYADLDSAYFALTVHLDEGNTSVPGAIRPVAFGKSTLEPTYDGTAMIRNSWVEFERAEPNRVEEIQRVNMLDANMKLKTMSKAARRDATYYNGAFCKDEYDFWQSCFRDLYKLSASGGIQDNMSLARDPVIIVPFKDLYKMAEVADQFPLGHVGNMHLHLDTEDAVPVACYATYGDTWTCNAIDASSTADRNLLTLTHPVHHPESVNLYTGMPINVSWSADICGGINDIVYETAPLDLSLTPGSYTVSGTDINTTSAGAGAVFTIQVNEATQTTGINPLTVAIDSSGANYFSGELLEVSGSLFGGSATEKLIITPQSIVGVPESAMNTYITRLESDNGDYKITLNDALPASGTYQQHVNVYFSMLAPDQANPTLTITEANLVVPKLMLRPEQLREVNKKIQGMNLPFMTWKRMEDNMGADTVFSKTYNLPPNVGNALTITPTNGLIAEVDDVTAARYSLNGFSTTDIAISPGTPFYRDRVIETFLNMQKPLSNLDENISENGETYNGEPVLYCQPVPLKPENQQLVINLEAGSAMTPKMVGTYLHKQGVLEFNEAGVKVVY